MAIGRGRDDSSTLPVESDCSLGIPLSPLGQHGILCCDLVHQAGLGHSPLKTGVDYISIAVPQMVGLLAGGAITTAAGH